MIVRTSKIVHANAPAPVKRRVEAAGQGKKAAGAAYEDRGERATGESESLLEVLLRQGRHVADRELARGPVRPGDGP